MDAYNFKSRKKEKKKKKKAEEKKQKRQTKKTHIKYLLESIKIPKKDTN